MTSQEKRQGNSLKDYFDFGEVWGYFFRKKSPEKPSFNLRMMHGINKFSIIVFLLALIYWIAKRLM